MKDTKSAAYYIENLTLNAWLFYIFPYFLKNKMEALKGLKQIYYFNNSSVGLILANGTLYFTQVRLVKAFSSRADIRNREGKLIWMEIDTDAEKVQDGLMNNPRFQNIREHYGKTHRILLFLYRCVFFHDVTNKLNKTLLLGPIFLIRVIENLESSNDQNKSPDRSINFFMQRRTWSVALEPFARKKRITIIPTGGTRLYLKKFLLLLNRVKSIIKQLMYTAMVIKYKVVQIISFKKMDSTSNTRDTVKQKVIEEGGAKPRLMVEYYGQLNLDSPELRSDLFFLQESHLSPRDILFYFNLPRDPVTDKMLAEVKRHEISAIAINSRATATPDIAVFKHKRDNSDKERFTYGYEGKDDIYTQKWLNQYVKSYQEKYDFWVDFVTRNNIKMHVSWNKTAPEYYVILDALHDTGGVGTAYQRSFEHFPMLWTYTTANVVFGSSQWGAHLKSDKHSIIPYYVTVGYLGDHRFSLLKKQASDVRDYLKSHGADRIMAYFDESFSDKVIQKSTVEYYQYLLNKVLECPWFGLILKPKKSKALRFNLKPIQELLYSVEQTGRCFVFDSSAGELQGSCPPAAASLGADVAVHGHFFAAAAGVEAAMAGTPTLFLDREGMPHSPLYRLGDQVIFKNIDSLWKACAEHWHSPGGIPGFGNWSGVLDEIDPFRDGRAAERMGTYLEWLMEGFKAGLPRETVLADAAERYGKLWGKDKILSVNSSQNEECIRSLQKENADVEEEHQPRTMDSTLS